VSLYHRVNIAARQQVNVGAAPCPPDS
jgi:hypothetical protein